VDGHERSVREGGKTEVEVLKRDGVVDGDGNVVRRGGESKKTSIRRGIRMINHGFIKDNMLGSLDSLRFLIVINYILESLGKTKKNAGASIREQLVGSSWASGKSINATTKHTKGTEIRFMARADFKWRRGTSAMWSNVV
jgi:hypothetical protein